MDVVLLLKAVVMGIVEGLTEFLPVSSTGHLILTGALLNFEGGSAKTFEIAIQMGAIFAVMLVYWQRIRDTLAGLGSERQAQRFALNVFVGFLPAGVIGVTIYKIITQYLFTPYVVASAFIVGAFINNAFSFTFWTGFHSQPSIFLALVPA